MFDFAYLDKSERQTPLMSSFFHILVILQCTRLFLFHFLIL